MQMDGARERLEAEVVLGGRQEGLAEGVAVMKGAPHLRPHPRQLGQPGCGMAKRVKGRASL